MNRRVSVTAAIVLGIFSMAWCQKSKVDMGEFSATVTKCVAGKTIVGKTFISRNKMRDESKTGEKAGATIIRMDKGVTWVLMENRQYMEMAGMDNQDLKLMEKESEQKFIIKSLGNEKVNGYLCEKKQYIDKEKKTGVTTMWYSPKLKYMVKNEHAQDGKLNFKMELSDIKEGKQPASLFEVPAGYTLFDPMSQVPPEMRGMMKGMMKGMIKGGMPKTTGSEGGEEE
jgi:outer membrane lipoprotein-sorting protein